jgi:predicted acylesterase/phospholipase RssA
MKTKATSRRPGPTNAPSQLAPSPAFGVVLSGGGSFGAWEVGALEALWDVWDQKHPGEQPPIQVVAGTSTGALIAPFALLDRAHVDQVDTWYQKVKNGDIFAFNVAALALPTAAFFFVEQSALNFDALRSNYKASLTEKKLRTLELCAAAWDERRLAIVTSDFGSGNADVVTNSPQDIDPTNAYDSRLFNGIIASAIAPLVGPAVPLEQGYAPAEKTPHFDGGVCSEAPFEALFEVASRAPQIDLTHVIVISSYPYFPGSDHTAKPFPMDPKFKTIGLRFDSLLSEASATKDIRIARAAIALRGLNVTGPDVMAMTGLSIPGNPPKLIEAVPRERMGWDNGEFVPSDMKRMRKLGYSEAKPVFSGSLP